MTTISADLLETSSYMYSTLHVLSMNILFLKGESLKRFINARHFYHNLKATGKFDIIQLLLQSNFRTPLK